MSQVALCAQNIRVSLGSHQAAQGDHEVLHGIDLSLPQGKWTSIVGPNGAGKSTLLKALAGLLPFSGHVFLFNQDVLALSPQQRAQQLSWLGQNEVASDDLRVWDVVMLGRLPHQTWMAAPSANDAQVVEVALKATQAWNWRERSLGQLSGGERQRVLLARAMAVQAQVMLMDEPLANLDPPHQVDWLEQVHCLRAQGTTVLSVLHEIGMALHADSLVVMREGRVVHHGAPSHASTRQAIQEVFEHRIRILPIEGQWVVLPKA
jgi:iron complex transport system ATP-binding protein